MQAPVLISPAIIISVFGLLAPAPVDAAVCTPIAATLCVGVDDYADVWINGQCVLTCGGTDFAYVDSTSSSPVACVSVNPAILSATGANYVAVRVRNTSPTEMWGTWALDIVCSDGGHSYVTSNDNFQFYDDPTGMTPPPLQGGLPWTDPNYVPAPAWGAPTQVSGSVFGKRAVDPQTGQQLPPMSWDANGDGPNGDEVMYFRQGFQLTPEPTPVPPQMTLSVASSVCAAQNGANFNLNVTLCNSGGITLSPTTAVLTLDPKFSFCGPWSNPAECTVVQSGQTVTITWPSFLGSSCDTVPICAVDYYIPPADDGYVTSNGYTLTSPGGNASGGVNVPLVTCIVFTPTPSLTLSPSPSVSPSFSASPSPAAPTATPSASLTPSASPSASLSPTLPPSPTASLTATPPPPHLRLSPGAANPDPAATTVWLPYVISTASTVDIKVYDVSGELVRALDPVAQAAGAQEQAWDLRNSRAAAVSSGVYLCRIHAQDPAGESQTVWMKAAVAR